MATEGAMGEVSQQALGSLEGAPDRSNESAVLAMECGTLANDSVPVDTQIRPTHSTASVFWSQSGRGVNYSSNPFDVVGTPRINPRAAVDYIAGRDVADFEDVDWTLVRGVNATPPGFGLKIKSSLSEPPAVTPEPVSLPPQDYKLSYTDSIETLNRSIEASVRADIARATETSAGAPIGVLLSGGVDSALVAAIVHDSAPQARLLVADKPYITQEEKRRIDEVARHLDSEAEYVSIEEPTSWVSRLVELNRGAPWPRANLGIPYYDALSRYMNGNDESVLFGGEGGDDLFGAPDHILSGLKPGRGIGPYLSLLSRRTADQGDRAEAYRDALESVSAPLLRRPQTRNAYWSISEENQRLYGLVAGRDFAVEAARSHGRWLSDRCSAAQKAGVDPFSYDLWTAHANGLNGLSDVRYSGSPILSPLLSREVMRSRLAIPHDRIVPSLNVNLDKPLLRDIASLHIPGGVAFSRKVNISTAFSIVVRPNREAVNWLFGEAAPVLASAGIEPQPLKGPEGPILPDWATALTYLRLIGLSAWIVGNNVQPVEVN